jgi:hypothetical protein
MTYNASQRSEDVVPFRLNALGRSIGASLPGDELREKERFAWS